MKSYNRILVCVFVFVLFCGCVVTTDPNTGGNLYSVDPNKANALETGAEVGIALAPLFGGAGVMVASALAGALAAWRKVKPGLVQAKSAAAEGHAAASALVTAIEEFKRKSPDSWKVMGGLIESQMTKQGIDPLVVKNVIRGLRGLPPLQWL